MENEIIGAIYSNSAPNKEYKINTIGLNNLKSGQHLVEVLQGDITLKVASENFVINTKLYLKQLIESNMILENKIKNQEREITNLRSQVNNLMKHKKLEERTTTDDRFSENLLSRIQRLEKKINE